MVHFWIYEICVVSQTVWVRLLNFTLVYWPCQNLNLNGYFKNLSWRDYIWRWTTLDSSTTSCNWSILTCKSLSRHSIIEIMQPSILAIFNYQYSLITSININIKDGKLREMTKDVCWFSNYKLIFVSYKKTNLLSKLSTINGSNKLLILVKVKFNLFMYRSIVVILFTYM